MRNIVGEEVGGVRKGRMNIGGEGGYGRIWEESSK